MTSVKPCDCKSEWQDKQYGKGNRVHNSRDGKVVGWTCTVCGTKKTGE